MPKLTYLRTIKPTFIALGMNKKNIILALFSCIALHAFAQVNYDLLSPQHPLSPKRETRAVWLTTLANLDWPKTYATSEATIAQQKQELVNILNLYAAANINTVLLQTRVRAATIYPSDIEPWDRCITGTEGKDPGYGYDPLRFAIAECHRRGMEVHAWVAAMPVGAKNSLGCRRLKQKGFSIKSFSSGAYLSPSDPKVAPYLGDICAEITRKYDIDGINLDYIRYPDGWRRPSYKNGDTPDARRANITRIVQNIHDKVKAIKPWVKISCSPIGKYSDLSRYSSKNFNARDRVSQDAQMWVRTGLMDQLYPMQYFRDDNYYPFCADWMENASGKDIVTGLGTYFLDPREGNWRLDEIVRQMYVSRQLGMGHAHFRSRFLTDNYQGIYYFEQAFNVLPALTPALTWQRATPPAAPRFATADNTLAQPLGNGTVNVSWKGNSPYYNIYMSTTSPVDITNPRNLVAARYTGTTFTHRPSQHYHYAITAMDRYGNESAPLQRIETKPTAIETKLMAHNNTVLTLPTWVQTMDVKYFTISTLQSTSLRKMYPTSKHYNDLNISALPNGTYVLYARSAKRNVTHRVGYFIVKRG